MVNLRWERAKTGFVGLHLAGQRHRKHAAPMEGPAKGNDAAAPGVGAGNLDGVFHRFCAGAEKRRLARPGNRHDGIDALGQRHVFRIRHHLVAAMGKALQLRGNGGLHLGVDMAGVEHGNAAGKVYEAASFYVPKLGVFGVVNKEVAHYCYAAGRSRQAAGMPLGIGASGCCAGEGGGFQWGIHGRFSLG